MRRDWPPLRTMPETLRRSHAEWFDDEDDDEDEDD
jgi:hypothetical protein